MFRNLINIIILTIVTSRFVMAASIPGSPSYDMSFTESDPSVMSINFHLDSMTLSIVHLNGNSYTNIEIGKTPIYQAVGNPSLPFIRKLVRLSETGRIEYDIDIKNEEFVDLNQAGYSDPLCPVQALRRKTNDAQPEFTINQAVYNNNDYYPQVTVQTNSPFNLGGVQVTALDFFPASYNPVKHTLRLIKDAVITIRIIDDNTLQKSTTISKKINSDIVRIAQDDIINQKDLVLSTDNTAFPVFLVIAGDRFINNNDLIHYITWKRQCGFDVELKSVSELGSEAISIKDSIIVRYNSANSLDFVLLVGDVADVPTWSGKSTAAETDAPYGQMDDDKIPDLLVGRFSAADDNDLEAIIQKSMAYEQCSTNDISDFNKLTFIATDASDYYDFVEATHDYVITTYLNNRGVIADHLKGYSGAATVDITNALNAGRSICHYSGHGIESEWQGPLFRIQDIGGLNSGSTPYLVISNACLTGRFEIAECFGESWIRTNDKGAFAFIGASNSTYWEPDDVMERAMYDTYFRDNIVSIGGMFYQGLLEVHLQYGTDYSNEYYEIYNILGDPSIKPWIGVPKQTIAIYNRVIEVGDQSYSVQVMSDEGLLNDAVATLVQKGEVIANGLSGIDGIVDLTINPATLQPGQIILTITADGQIPVIDTLIVTSPMVVTVEPAEIPVGVVANVSITVADSNANFVEGLNIFLSGWTLSGDSLLGTSDHNGNLTFQCTPKFGENLLIYGKQTDSNYYTFIETLIVSGADQFGNPEVVCNVETFDIDGFLIPDFTGQINGFTDQSDCRIAVKGCGVDTVTSGNSLTIIPDSAGFIRVALLKPGYTVYEESFVVKKAFGTANVNVTDTNLQSLDNVTLSGYLLSDTTQPVFSGTTDENGDVSISSALGVGFYLIKAWKFGYQSMSVSDTVKYGVNQFNLVMTESPRTTVSGRITGGTEAVPLNAKLAINRYISESQTFNMELETTSENYGSYEIDLPFGEYKFTASASYYISEVLTVTVEDQVIAVDFNLDTTRASILLLDDDSGKRAIDKENTYTVDEKGGKGSSATTIQQVLESAGFYVNKTDYTIMLDPEIQAYDVLILSSGSNQDPVQIGGVRSMLENYMTVGGRLLVEGGELAYDAASSPGYPSFAKNVLHVSSWNNDQAGPLYRVTTDHELTTQPYELASSISIGYTAYGDEDACTPLADAQLIYRNNFSYSQGGIILYEDGIPGNKMVFYTFAYDKITSADTREKLLINTIEYLLKEPDYSRGDINKDRQIDILDLTNLVNMILEKDKEIDEFRQWAADLNDDKEINVLDLVRIVNVILGRVGITKPVGAGEQYISLKKQDDKIFVETNTPVTALQVEFEKGCEFEVSSDITGVDGVTIKKMNDILLVFNTSGEPAILGNSVLGTIDRAGTIKSAVAANQTGQKITVVLDQVPECYMLYSNYPNPFNSNTVFRFDLPKDTHVTLELFDLLGRRVAVLLDEERHSGSYNFVWNGRDGNGRNLPSGVYFYMFHAGEYQSIRKLVLLK